VKASPESAGDALPSAGSFEDSIRRLSEIVEALEAGDLPLEQSLKLFEEGVKLSRASQATLDGAERRVEELLSVDETGEPVVREIDVE
jgi:exodeoxyribonuclease VII small subunit